MNNNALGLDQMIQLSEISKKSEEFPEFERKLYSGIKDKIYHLLLAEYNVCENANERSAMLLAITPAIIEFGMTVEQDNQI